MSKSFTELTDATDGTGGVGAWIPSEHYAGLILGSVANYSELAGKVTAMNYDMGAGMGNTVNVRTITARDNVQELSGCDTTGQNDCLSSASTTFGDYTIDIKMQGDRDIVCDFAVWKSTGDAYMHIANEMAKSLATWRDDQLYADLVGTSANTTIYTSAAYTTSRTTDSCCNFAFDIYNSIIDARQHLLHDGYEPDTIIIHPDVASYLYYKENGDMPDLASLVKYTSDGYIASIAGMKVIESRAAYQNNNSPTTSGDDLAFVIDSSRALGEAWGKKPTFTQKYHENCNNYNMVVWTYWGHSTLDTDAIVDIENP